MTLLDHSSIDALFAGLNEDHGVFHFLYENGGTTEPWKLVQVYTFRYRRRGPLDAVRLLVNFPHTGMPDAYEGYRLWLDSGWLVVIRWILVGKKSEWQRMTGLFKMRVVRQAVTMDDTLQRADRRRDRGLADIFGVSRRASLLDTNYIKEEQ